jgi:hypothetical protein
MMQVEGKAAGLLRYTRVLFTQPLKKLLIDHLGSGSPWKARAWSIEQLAPLDQSGSA